MRSTPSQVQGIADKGGGALLAGVGREPVAAFPGGGVEPGKVRRRVVALGAGEADGGKVLAPGLGGLELGQGLGLRQVPEEAQDQSHGLAPAALGVTHRARETAHDSVQRHALGRVGLRLDHDLRMHNALVAADAEVVTHEVVEVFLRAQHRGPVVVEVEEALQVREGAGGFHVGLARIGQLHAVLCRQLQQAPGLQGAVDMQVQLAFRGAADPAFEVFAHGGLSRPV